MIQAIRRLRRFVNPVVATFALVIAVTIMFGLALRAYDRYHRMWYISIAAGGADGESYLIAGSLKNYIQHHFKNVRVSVIDTKGTAANLHLLETGRADLATAQADVALDRWIQPRDGDRDKDKQGRLVSALYLDIVQLLICSDRNIRTATQVFANFRDTPKTEYVYVPYEGEGRPSGGQVETFQQIAEYFELQEGKDYQLSNDHGLAARACDSSQRGNVIFRIRAPGNAGIQDAVENGWRLVAIRPVGALCHRNQAFHPSVIARGTYRSGRKPQLSKAEPPEPLETLEIARIVVAKRNESIPDWLIHQLTRALNEEGMNLAKFRATPTSSTILRQLFLRIPSLNREVKLSSLGVPFHQAAATYYEPQLAWSTRLNDWADTYSLGLTVFAMFISFLIALNRGFEWMGKSHLDDLIAEMTRLMAMENRTGSQTDPKKDTAGFPVSEVELKLLTEMSNKENYVVYWLIVGLLDGRHREHKMAKFYEEASRDFRKEEFSPESFRTFSEAYKSARESIETASEKKRRDLVEFYVGALLGNLSTEHNPYQGVSQRVILLEAQRILGVSPMFSRGGFRTLAEAYGLATGSS